VTLPQGLITGKTARLPTDWKKQAKAVGLETPNRYESLFITLWTTMFPQLPAPTAQYRFHDTRKWRLDFAWLSAMDEPCLESRCEAKRPRTGREEISHPRNADEKGEIVMGCKTCDHTMQRVAAIGVFWCPQCGSLKREFFDGDHPEHEEPIIVHRALTFCDAARVCIADKLGSVEVRLLSPVSTPDRTMRALDRCEVALRECCLAPRDR